MEMRRFGRTGFEISALTLGAGWVGGIMIDPADEVRIEALRRVMAAGCNWVDTAASYGQGESEMALGRLLPMLETSPHISTKVGLDPAKADDFEGEIRRSLEASLKRLGMERVSLFQLHNSIAAERDARALTPADLLCPGGIADIFDKLGQEGYFDAHGITALGEAPAIAEVMRSGRFATAQIYVNMINPTALRAVPTAWGGQDFAGLVATATQADMGIMAIRVLAAGVLATEQRHGREVIVAADADIAREEARAAKLKAALGLAYGTPAQTAIRFALAQGELSTIVVGMATLDHLEEALGAFEAGPLPQEALARIEDVYKMGI